MSSLFDISDYEEIFEEEEEKGFVFKDTVRIGKHLLSKGDWLSISFGHMIKREIVNGTIKQLNVKYENNEIVYINIMIEYDNDEVVVIDNTISKSCTYGTFRDTFHVIDWKPSKENTIYKKVKDTTTELINCLNFMKQKGREELFQNLQNLFINELYTRDIVSTFNDIYSTNIDFKGNSQELFSYLDNWLKENI